MSDQELDQSFRSRLDSAVKTVAAWQDPDLLKACRKVLPWDDIYKQPSDYYTVLFLAKYFKESFMTWVDKPACQYCSSKEHVEFVNSQKDEYRYEVYKCTQCGDDMETRFYRYNSPLKLLETRQGRCGEFANLFGAICTSLGLETRYVVDFSDHVWVEVNIVVANNNNARQWTMVDSCEGVVDEPSMYEKGWGKTTSISYIIGVATTHVIDLTPKYTRMFFSDDLQSRRRNAVSSEGAGNEIIQSLCTVQMQSSKLSKVQAEELQDLLHKEETALSKLKQETKWDEEGYNSGRISGSLAWKVSRNEAGMNASSTESAEPVYAAPDSFKYESFYPRSKTVQLGVYPPSAVTNVHGGIVVSKVNCAVATIKKEESFCVNVVVVDHEPKCFGAILLCKAFTLPSDLVAFCKKLPLHRIVLMQGRMATNTADTSVLRQLEYILGGFRHEACTETDGLLYMGQVGASPDWAICQSFTQALQGCSIQASATGNDEYKLQTLRSAHPSSISGRVPDEIMSLPTQVAATWEAKQAAFNMYCSRLDKHTCFGYTTKPGMPIYLLDQTGFPFVSVESDTVSDSQDDNEWCTFVYQASPLVSKDDNGITSKNAKTNNTADTPAYVVPTDTGFFTQLLGNQLLMKASNGNEIRTDTASAIYNKRLIGLYFSAHWCGPCRSFTPILAELYTVLDETHDAHGLQIVFVSSDRDQTSFQNYYQRSMPWCAIPFKSLASYKNTLSMQYQVQGIPSLVILDAVSGEVVVNSRTSRSEVMRSCQRGEQAIIDMLSEWKSRVPQSTTELLDIMQQSCTIEAGLKNDDDNDTHALTLEQSSYLYNNGELKVTPLTLKERTAKHFKRIQKSGVTIGHAAAEAVSLVSQEGNNVVEFDAGPLDGVFAPVDSFVNKSAAELVDEMPTWQAEIVLQTVKKYMENIVKTPWSPKFRRFKLSNKNADIIVSSLNGLSLLRALGWDVEFAGNHYVAVLPVATNLTAVQEAIEQLSMQSVPA